MTRRLIPALLLAACCAGGQSPLETVNPELFPGLGEIDDTELRWHGLAGLYPGRVIESEPARDTESARDEAARVEELGDGIVYIRVYRLPEADPVIAANASSPALIIDLRYTRARSGGSGLAALGPHAGVEAVGSVPVEVAESLVADSPAGARGAPAIVLVNGRTAGPFEALLDGLQRSGSALLIGSPTGGGTGFYEAAPGGLPFRVLRGELRAAGGESLIGGGLAPRIAIATTAEEEYASYFLFEGGSDIAALIDGGDEPAEHGDGGETDELDPVLGRAVDVIAALQVLERLPD